VDIVREQFVMKRDRCAPIPSVMAERGDDLEQNMNDTKGRGMRAVA
jgi:hypothetical protein